MGKCERRSCLEPAACACVVRFWNGERMDSEQLCDFHADLLRQWGLSAPSVQSFSATPLRVRRPHLGACA